MALRLTTRIRGLVEAMDDLEKTIGKTFTTEVDEETETELESLRCSCGVLKSTIESLLEETRR